ncbi:MULTISPECIES: hypothetical protein [unclassified Rhizobium]|uniref:hypothetical protein n=1 Tax=unclassified Rhizobium TaxID=2613769 RepID=UPI00161230D8|nr:MULTISPECIES: hypothetical protein [unclassified Rhizobium]MBB3545169.1 hypothetical protein [Rhizobium sp. BK399]MCS3743582.1 hypothetical protein [Rhizobium sp. BK661]MCS4096531.1 hypothetical protein [Rhizobium sp. BK176]
MSLKHTFSTLAVAATLGVLTSSTVIAENAITAPATKSIGTSSTQKTELVPSLIVMNSDGATLKGDTLTLTSVSSNSILFADRPVRSAGHALTAHLLEEWAQGGSFEKDPPNATVSVLNKDASGVEDAVVVLKEPKLEGTNLTFKVDVLEGNLAEANGPASIFIDIIGMPRTPMSFAGVARRTAYRGAWYGAAAAGAAAATYDRPYYRPYYPPSGCGYYPLPPC